VAHDRPAQAQSVSVLAFIDELSADPGLLRSWGREFRGTDPIALVIHPADWSPSDVAETAQRIVDESGMGDGPDSAEIRALTGPLDARDEASLREVCVATYGNVSVPEAFAELPSVRPQQIHALRDFLPRREPPADAGDGPLRLVRASEQSVPAHPEPNLLNANINGAWTVSFRDTSADRTVMDQIFTEESYSLARLTRWPGIRRLTAAGPDAPRPLIVDAGANFGASCVYFALLHPQAMIVAVEPEPGNYRLLQRNAAQIAHAYTVQAALASRTGHVQITDPGIGDWGFRAGADVAQGPVIGEVRAITIGDILAAAGPATPFILKVDIEGAEGEVFAEHQAALNRFPIVMVELHDWMIPERETSRPFLRWHLEHGRDFMSIGENTLSISADLRR
jgi:FkbM family methyltransferase